MNKVPKDMKTWLLRFPLVCVAAALMGWVGLILMLLGTPVFPGINDFWTHYVCIASILIWSLASFMLKDKAVRTWALFGIASPILGALLVAPPASFAVLLAKSYIAFPVGLTTGVIMYAIVCTGNRHNQAVNRSRRLAGILKL